MSANRFAARFFALFAAATMAFLAGCYYVPDYGYAGASVKLARSLGSNVGGMTLEVSGPGMTPIVQTFAGNTKGTTIQVLSGIDRTFALTASTPSVILSGSTTVDLSPGETKSVVIDPVLSDVKLEIPDANGFKLVQIADMTGAGWSELHAADLVTFSPPPQSDLEPSVTDFDNQGRLYVANLNAAPLFVSTLFCVDDITSPSSYTIIASNPMYAMAVDRVNDRVYYSDGSTTVFWKPTSDLGGGPSSTDVGFMTGSGSIRMLAVDDRGVLYFVVSGQSSMILYSYDPSNLGVAGKSYSGLSQPRDVMVKGGYVYVADLGPAVAFGPKIIRLTRDLVFMDEFAGPPTDPINMPTRFIKTMDKRIIVLDENRASINNYDRLVSFTDMAGDNWTTFGSAATAIQGIVP